jgi:hypothetical protein
MKRAVALALLLAPMATGAQGLNMKTGAWEMSFRTSASSRPSVYKDCVTKADLAQLAAGPDKDDDGDCRYTTPPTLSGNRWSGERVCPDGRKVRSEFVAESPERVKGTIMSSGGKGPSMNAEIAGRWLGASCAGIN